MNPAAFGSLPSDACTLGTAGSFGPDRIAKTIYDGAGQVLQDLRAFGTSIQQAYATNTWTPNGKLASVYDADGSSHITAYTYDGFDRLAVTAFADGTSDQNTSYDADGNVLTRLNRSGQAFTFAYDALDRMISKVVPAAGAIPANTISTSYDLLGHVTGVSDTNGNMLADVYDRAGRMTAATRTTPNLSSKTVSYQYDQAGNRTRLTWPDGYYANYAYDALNHPTTVTDSASTTLATYAYDTLGRRSSLQYSGTSGAAMSYSWSPEDDLVTLASDFAGTANDVSFTNDFTPAHQWNSTTISNAAFRFAPPATTSASYGTVNGVNQYPSVGGSTWTYDTRGNLTGTTAAAPAVMAYDAENRMMADSAAYATYAYDPEGRRTTKIIATTGSGPLWGSAVWGAFTWTARPTTTTSFLHDGDSEIAQYDNTGSLVRRFVPGPAIDEYIAQVTAAGTTTYFHTDKMGSVIAMSDSSGNLAEGAYTYDGYGNCMVGGSYCTAAGIPFRYTGQRLDPETALYYYRARYYSSAYGRFNQNDSVGYQDDLNLYTYVGNDPTDELDPFGEAECVTTPGGIEHCVVERPQFAAPQMHVFVKIGLAVARGSPVAIVVCGILCASPTTSSDTACNQPGCSYPAMVNKANKADKADKARERKKKEAKRQLKTNSNFRNWFHKSPFENSFNERCA